MSALLEREVDGRRTAADLVHVAALEVQPTLCRIGCIPADAIRGSA